MPWKQAVSLGCFHLCSHQTQQPTAQVLVGTHANANVGQANRAAQSPTIDPASWVSREQASLHNHPGLVIIIIIIIISLSSKERTFEKKKKKNKGCLKQGHGPCLRIGISNLYLASLCRRESCLVRPHPFARSALLMRCSLELGPRGICCPCTSSSN